MDSLSTARADHGAGLTGSGRSIRHGLGLGSRRPRMAWLRCQQSPHIFCGLRFAERVALPFSAAHAFHVVKLLFRFDPFRVVPIPRLFANSAIARTMALEFVLSARSGMNEPTSLILSNG